MNAVVLEHVPLSVLIDTDVLIWHLRGYPQATQRLAIHLVKRHLR
jgi:hypothetical protein